MLPSRKRLQRPARLSYLRQMRGRHPGLAIGLWLCEKTKTKLPELEREPGKHEEAAAGSDAELQETPVWLSNHEYSHQVHKWLWQSYCSYLTWHSGLATFPAYCNPQLPPTPYQPAVSEYVIPSLAHRFIAEMVDFFILFFIKATIVLSITHHSGIK
ncbi:PREDICTED: protein FAM8A1-like [Chrysochloris asiatica]|uniref:Protein FAM8A1-like n=1 Tax=Chrysochloris asiatica TaxID=185453 RepID=A0A9B0U255_CHRAS|nr:PREDICTED: protein FAM8A1-like [Chrysochloris asiatica]